MKTAKETLEEIHGSDITLLSTGLAIQAMEAYADQFKNQMGGRTPHRCPVCNGNGKVPNGFYNQTSGVWSSNAFHEDCKSCSGTGIVWG